MYKLVTYCEPLINFTGNNTNKIQKGKPLLPTVSYERVYCDSTDCRQQILSKHIALTQIIALTNI